MTLNALVAANEILVPIQCEYYALEGVTQLLRTIDLVKGELNNELRLSTVLLTMFDARTKLAAQVADEVRQHFPVETLQALPSAAPTIEALASALPDFSSYFNPEGTPVSVWNDIPIMPQATAGTLGAERVVGFDPMEAARDRATACGIEVTSRSPPRRRSGLRSGPCRASSGRSGSTQGSE